jgi:thioredoxin reductase
LSAATWLARHRRRVALVDAGERRNRWVERTHGYLGLDPVDPRALVERAKVALLAYPTAEIVGGRVTAAEARPDGSFSLDVDAGGERREVRARRVVLATGVEDLFPDVDGFFEHYGADVFHCPTCDGYEARDRDVVAFGWTDQVAGFALELLEWAAGVTVVTDGSRFQGDAVHLAALTRHGIDVLEDEADALLGRRGALEGVRLRGGRTVACQMAFFSIGHRPRTELAAFLGCALTSEGCVVVDGDFQTTVPGVYAAGDVVPGIQLVQVAAAEGTIAGVHAALSLRGQPPGPDAPEPGPDVEEELLSS